MSAEQIFSFCGSVAAVGWLILILAPRRHWASTVIAGRVIPLLISSVYLILLAAHWTEKTGGFGSLAEVTLLFSNRWLLLAGWSHYLAFDLFIGSWEVRDAADKGISHWLVIPCLALTFLFGPVGLLSYFGVRATQGMSIRNQQEQISSTEKVDSSKEK